jgi:hypothetical protein
MPQNDTFLLRRKKNAKTHLFGQKHQEVPCFFKEVRFEKRAPLVISREFVNPFAKTGGKASILARPATSRLSAPFAACFLGTDAQKTGNAVLTGRLFSQTARRCKRAVRMFRKHPGHPKNCSKTIQTYIHGKK